jgi:thiol-disulfide isomerase/thioredoxin
MSEDEVPKANSEAKAPPKTWALKAGLILLGFGALAFLYVVFAATSKPQASSYARFATGSLSRLAVLEAPPGLPSETFRNLAGEEARLSDLLSASGGQPMLVNFWATWCPPCVAELPTLGALARRYEGRLRVVTVNVDELSVAPRAAAMLAERGGGALPFWQDYSRYILFSSAAPGLPTTILYDAEGRELARVAGEADWESPEAQALIEAALAAP